ncbi:hypothetical protein PSMK_08820 [Phycisphaera mikurensis NBRC 102666]|uniref:Uncharacterized protein n=1 Tax=Phycisphaera mikurensis (strain NBRC 102666 / KCTC 22515 / FYK2301M01) TaxID=1142394 RepID=I0ICQ3_PHYMF|nr:hypothetical protein PSMK_08820 [Phycisphaera mikurensis NBRC 102666]
MIQPGGLAFRGPSAVSRIGHDGPRIPGLGVPAPRGHRFEASTFCTSFEDNPDPPSGRCHAACGVGCPQDTRPHFVSAGVASGDHHPASGVAPGQRWRPSESESSPVALSSPEGVGTESARRRRGGGGELSRCHAACGVGCPQDTRPTFVSAGVASGDHHPASGVAPRSSTATPTAASPSSRRRSS